MWRPWWLVTFAVLTSLLWLAHERVYLGGSAEVEHETVRAVVEAYLTPRGADAVSVRNCSGTWQPILSLANDARWFSGVSAALMPPGGAKWAGYTHGPRSVS